MNYLIDPSDVIKYDRTKAELELFWLFCTVVAGKTATTQARLLAGFLSGMGGDSPFEGIRCAEQSGTLLRALVDSRLGQFNRLHKLFVQSLAIDLATCTVDDLEKLHGCGPKTARMFLMMSRPKQRYAALDTHVLKHLRASGIDAPRATPSAGSTYRRLEEAFVSLADQAGMEVSEYDLMVWKSYAT